MDFREIIPYIKLSDFPEGEFNVTVELPDGSAVELLGRVNIHGRWIRSGSDDEGYFFGKAEFNLRDWTAWDDDGNVIGIINSTWFENYMEEQINKKL